jgi:hypothetical protein
MKPGGEGERPAHRDHASCPAPRVEGRVLLGRERLSIQPGEAATAMSRTLRLLLRDRTTIRRDGALPSLDDNWPPCEAVTPIVTGWLLRSSRWGRGCVDRPSPVGLLASKEPRSWANPLPKNPERLRGEMRGRPLRWNWFPQEPGAWSWGGRPKGDGDASIDTSTNRTTGSPHQVSLPTLPAIARRPSQTGGEADQLPALPGRPRRADSGRGAPAGVRTYGNDHGEGSHRQQTDPDLGFSVCLGCPLRRRPFGGS